MDLYTEVFGDVRVKDLEAYKLHNNGVSTKELSKQFGVSRQRLHKVFQKLDHRVVIFTIRMKKELDNLSDNEV